MQVSRTASDSGRNVSTVVVEAVADAQGISPTELEPLHRVVNADALNALYDPKWDDRDAATTVSFTYADCEVTVSGRGEVVVRPADESGPATSA